MAAPAPAVALHLLPALPDETLEEIFLRLPTPASLARASAACTTFRRIVAERSFLRRYRNRHPPPLLGLVDDRGDFMLAEAPHPSAPLAEALVAAADFTYSFVPKPTGDTSWYARDGRVLLESSGLLRRTRSIRTTSYAVCDPLSRRYVLLPPIPEDMTVQQEERLAEFEPNLAPAGEDEDEDDETCFKVLHCALQDQVGGVCLPLRHRTMACRCIVQLGFLGHPRALSADLAPVQLLLKWLLLLDLLLYGQAARAEHAQDAVFPCQLWYAA